jgi:hypothetical protein
MISAGVPNFTVEYSLEGRSEQVVPGLMNSLYLRISLVNMKAILPCKLEANRLYLVLLK